MRRFLFACLMCLCLTGRAQQKHCPSPHCYQSFYSRYYIMGESNSSIRKTVSITIDRDTMTVVTPTKKSSWPISFIQTSTEDTYTIDIYSSGDTQIRLVYAHDALESVVFARYLTSFQFFISYPQSL